MKIKRYQAVDMRTALRQIRQEQGPDAVILSTQAIDGGVEVCAADDADYQQASAAAQPATFAASMQVAARAQPGATTNGATALNNGAGNTVDNGAMSAELRSLRALLEHQLATLSWNDFTRRDPVRARALNELMDLGLARDDAWPLVQSLPADALAATGSHAHYEALAQALRTIDLELLAQGAVVMVGPPGAGKSTLLAKLAVRAVVEHGSAQLAIVTLDTQRLGASEQTRSIGRLLGVETHAVEDATTLAALAARWSHKRLVLIDTAGTAPRDAQAIAALSQLLAGIGAHRTLLVLPASAQGEVLDGCLERFAPLVPQAVVLTRVDEALSLGGALAALLRHRLPLAAIANGPRVPEDLRPARSADLVAAAVGLKAETNVRRDIDHAAA